MTKFDDGRTPESRKAGTGDGHAMGEVLNVIRDLLAEKGCPWDRKQTPHTLADYLIEESFELVEAVRVDAPVPPANPDGQDDDAPEAPGAPRPMPDDPQRAAAEVMEELGDVFFLLLFVAELYQRDGRFTLNDVFRTNAAKMIRRHPHVFADLTLDSREELLKNWERIKRDEKDDGNGAPSGVYDSLPKGLPPMLKAYRIHSKAARTGFTWDSDQGAENQLVREWEEWMQAKASEDPSRMEEEFGDFLFTLVEIGRRHGIKANAALDRANAKFLRRFAAMETLAAKRGLSLPDMDLASMDALWDEVKAAQG